MLSVATSDDPMPDREGAYQTGGGELRDASCSPCVAISAVGLAVSIASLNRIGLRPTSSQVGR